MKKRVKQERRPYQKPEIERVELVAEEQVLGGCKTEFTGGGQGLGGTGHCVTDGTPSACVYTTGT